MILTREGILDEAEEVMKQNATPEALDAAIIMSAQKVEHYEIASFGSAACWADQMGRQDIKSLLGQTLQEEEQTDERLTQLARRGINAAAENRQREFAA